LIDFLQGHDFYEKPVMGPIADNPDCPQRPAARAVGLVFIALVCDFRIERNVAYFHRKPPFVVLGFVKPFSLFLNKTLVIPHLFFKGLASPCKSRVLCGCDTIKEASPYAQNSPLHHLDMLEVHEE
jgi:hypothetical protein